jgi:hypothetical protein
MQQTPRHVPPVAVQTMALEQGERQQRVRRRSRPMGAGGLERTKRKQPPHLQNGLPK